MKLVKPRESFVRCDLSRRNPNLRFDPRLAVARAQARLQVGSSTPNPWNQGRKIKAQLISDRGQEKASWPVIHGRGKAESEPIVTTPVGLKGIVKLDLLMISRCSGSVKKSLPVLSGFAKCRTLVLAFCSFLSLWLLRPWHVGWVHPLLTAFE